MQSFVKGSSLTRKRQRLKRRLPTNKVRRQRPTSYSAWRQCYSWCKQGSKWQSTAACYQPGVSIDNQLTHRNNINQSADTTLDTNAKLFNASTVASNSNASFLLSRVESLMEIQQLFEPVQRRCSSEPKDLSVRAQNAYRRNPLWRKQHATPWQNLKSLTSSSQTALEDIAYQVCRQVSCWRQWFPRRLMEIIQCYPRMRWLNPCAYVVLPWTAHFNLSASVNFHQY